MKAGKGKTKMVNRCWFTIFFRDCQLMKKPVDSMKIKLHDLFLFFGYTLLLYPICYSAFFVRLYTSHPSFSTDFNTMV